MTDPSGPERTQSREKRPLRWIVGAIVLATLIIAGAVVVTRHDEQPPVPPNAGPAPTAPLEVKLAESDLSAPAGQVLTANLTITGGPAFRLTAQAKAPDGVTADAATEEQASSNPATPAGAIVKVSTGIAAGDGTKAIEVTVRGCAKDADACGGDDQLTAKAAFDVTLERPDPNVVPAGVAKPAPSRVVDADGGKAVVDEYEVLTAESLSVPDATAAALSAAKATKGTITGGVPEIGVFDIVYPGTGQADWPRLTEELKAQPSIAEASVRNVTPPHVDRMPAEFGSAAGGVSEWKKGSGGKAWNLQQIHADWAWDLDPDGRPGSPDLKAGIIDNGIHTGHEDLRENVKLVNRYGSLPSNNFNSRGEVEGHGTHVAASMCGKGDNTSGRGAAGVAWDCALNVYDYGGDTDATGIALMMVRAIDDGNRVVNLSFGWGRDCWSGGKAELSDRQVADYERLFSRAFMRARSSNGGLGTLFVVAAGNGCEDSSTNPPASLAAKYPDVVLSVGAVNANGHLSWGSNNGPSVAVAAGGGQNSKSYGVFSAWTTKDKRFADDSYAFEQGTSMAAPQVAGVGVLVASAHPTLTSAQIRSCIVDHAGSLAGEDIEPHQGSSLPRRSAATSMHIVDAEQAVKCGDEKIGAQPVLPPGAVAPGTVGPSTPAPVNTFAAPQVVVVMDTSGSMADNDQTGKTVKMVAAKQALTDFINGLSETTSVGLWSYPLPSNTAGTGGCATSGGALIGSLASGTTPLRRGDMSASVNSMRPDGDTPTGPALRAAAGMFRGNGPRTIVLVSDGEPTCGEGTKDGACEVAHDLANQGITSIYTVGFQLSAGGKKLMQCVADAAHGTYVDVVNGGDLKDKIPELARAKLGIEMNLPARTSIDIGSGQTPSAPIKVKVTNTGSADAYDAQVSLSFDKSAGTTGSGNRRIGNLMKGESREVQWNFRPNGTFNDIDVEFRATASAVNADEAAPVAKHTIVSGRVNVDQAGPLLKDKTNPVVFGDSYSAGEGGFIYDEETDTYDNACHRSKVTYAANLFPRQLVQGDHTRHVFACSGAVAQDVFAPSTEQRELGDASRALRSQVDQYRSTSELKDHPADVALLTLGGNDMGFRDVIINCVTPRALNLLHGKAPSCDSEADKKTRLDKLRALPASLRQAYLAIDRELNSKDALTNRGGKIAPIVVLAYPNAFPEASASGDGCAKDLSGGEENYASWLSAKLNLVIYDTIELLRNDGYPIYFAWDTVKAMRPEHTLCGSEKWVNELDWTSTALFKIVEFNRGWDSYWYGKTYAAWKARKIDSTAFRTYQAAFHPNAAGYQALAAALVRYSNSGPALRPVTHPPNLEVVDDGGSSLGPRGDIVLQGGSQVLQAAPGGVYSLSTGQLDPHASYELVVRSDPRVVAHGNADDSGNVRVDVMIPPDLAPGDHELVLQSPKEDGSLLERRQAIAVTVPPPRWWVPLGVVSFLLLVGAAVSWLLSRRAERHPTVTVPT